MTAVTCLTTDLCLTADPGVASLILAQPLTFKEIAHEIISTVIPLPSAISLKIKAKVYMCTRYWLTACSSLPRKKCNR